MALPASPAPLEDRSRYPLHEEDDVPEIPFHERVVRYLRDALEARFPDRFVTGNACIYWEPGNYADYAAPDVFVAEGWPRQPKPRVYLSFEDPPILFVAEIASRTTRRIDTKAKPDVYGEILAVPEYLFYDPDTGEFWLRRLRGGGYEEVEPEPTGRLRSEVLELEFGADPDGFLWAYTPDGERLLTHAEAEARRQEAEARRQEAEARRQEAEALAAREAKGRASESRRRRAAEARAAELERQLAELRARLGE
jgi:Uma2 family endonuclease